VRWGDVSHGMFLNAVLSHILMSEISDKPPNSGPSDDPAPEEEEEWEGINDN
jgi:hypothetical protein